MIEVFGKYTHRREGSLEDAKDYWNKKFEDYEVKITVTKDSKYQYSAIATFDDGDFESVFINKIEKDNARTK